MTKLGSQGLEVSKLGFGCMGITAFYGAPMEDAAALELLKGVHAAGYTLFDTAEVYRSGNPFDEPTSETKFNETIVGEFARSVPRESVTIATKFHPDLWNKYDLATVEKSLDASLGRLGLPFVDIYYLHRMPKTLDELKEWMHSAAALVKAGKIRYLGLSEVSPSWLRAAHEIFPVSVVQQEWSLLTRSPIEDVLVPICVELGIGVVAYSPLARNLLAEQKETPTGWRLSLPRYSPENFQKNKELTAQISALGRSKNATASELSLAWLYHRAAQLGVSMCAIPGTTKIANALSNLRSVQISLSDDEVKALGDLGALAAGARGPEDYTSRGMEGQLDPSASAATGDYCTNLRCANFAPCSLHP